MENKVNENETKVNEEKIQTVIEKPVWQTWRFWKDLGIKVGKGLLCAAAGISGYILYENLTNEEPESEETEETVEETEE